MGLGPSEDQGREGGGAGAPPGPKGRAPDVVIPACPLSAPLGSSGALGAVRRPPARGVLRRPLPSPAASPPRGDRPGTRCPPVLRRPAARVPMRQDGERGGEQRLRSLVEGPTPIPASLACPRSCTDYVKPSTATPATAPILSSDPLLPSIEFPGRALSPESTSCTLGRCAGRPGRAREIRPTV